jgi:hypothetical protein
MNNVAGRGKGRKYFIFTLNYNYLFIVGVIVHILYFIYPLTPKNLSFGIDIYMSSEIQVHYFPVIP